MTREICYWKDSTNQLGKYYLVIQSPYGKEAETTTIFLCSIQCAEALQMTCCGDDWDVVFQGGIDWMKKYEEVVKMERERERDERREQENGMREYFDEIDVEDIFS